MKVILRSTPYIIIFYLLVTIFFLKECSQPKPSQVPVDPVTTTTITKYLTDTVYITVPQVYPFPVYHDTGSIHFVILPADTFQIVKDYLSRNIYKRILVDDTNAKITLIDTVTHNKLLNGTLFAQYYPHTQTITETRYIASTPKRKLFLGAGLALNPNRFGIIPSLMYGSPKDNFYSVGYDPVNSNLHLTLWWKIRLKK
jgi:hypothetical protein